MLIDIAGPPGRIDEVGYGFGRSTRPSAHDHVAAEAPES